MFTAGHGGDQQAIRVRGSRAVGASDGHAFGPANRDVVMGGLQGVFQGFLVVVCWRARRISGGVGLTDCVGQIVHLLV